LLSLLFPSDRVALSRVGFKSNVAFSRPWMSYTIRQFALEYPAGGIAMPNIMGGHAGPRRPPGPDNTFSWWVPETKGICNWRIYLYFLVSLARVLGMRIEENGKTITDHSQLSVYHPDADLKRVTISFTLTE
jgi:hypothetical protein